MSSGLSVSGAVASPEYPKIKSPSASIPAFCNSLTPRPKSMAFEMAVLGLMITEA